MGNTKFCFCLGFGKSDFLSINNRPFPSEAKCKAFHMKALGSTPDRSTRIFFPSMPVSFTE